MKDTYVDLDIAFLDVRGKICEIYTMTRLSEKAITSQTEAQYAIELPAGWFRKNKVLVGDVIEVAAIHERLIKSDF